MPAMIRSSLLILSLLAAPAFAQVPPQPAPVPKPNPVASATIPAGPLYAGDLIVIDGSASVGDSIDWELISPPDVATYVIDSNGKTVAFSNKTPGTFVFRLESLSVIGGKITKSKQRVAFTTVSSTPVPPQPPPGPPVPPVPNPVTLAKPFIVTLVSDSDAMTQPLADVRDSLTLAASPLQSALATMGGRGTSVDVKSAEFVRRNLAPFLTASDATGPAVPGPAVVIQDTKGRVLLKVAAPADSASLITYLKGLTGSN